MSFIAAMPAAMEMPPGSTEHSDAMKEDGPAERVVVEMTPLPPSSPTARFNGPASIAAAKARSSKSLVMNAKAYAAWMRRQRELWKDLPDLSIDYCDLTYTVPTQAKDAPIPTAWQMARDTLTGHSLRQSLHPPLPTLRPAVRHRPRPPL